MILFSLTMTYYDNQAFYSGNLIEDVFKASFANPKVPMRQWTLTKMKLGDEKRIAKKTDLGMIWSFSLITLNRYLRLGVFWIFLGRFSLLTPPKRLPGFGRFRWIATPILSCTLCWDWWNKVLRFVHKMPPHGHTLQAVLHVSQPSQWGKKWSQRKPFGLWRSHWLDLKNLIWLHFWYSYPL